MLLTGSFIRTLDEKQRLAIPKSVRDALGGESSAVFYVAPGTDGSLVLYPEEGFEQLAGQLAEASPAGAQVRAFSRLFYARARRVEMDRHGRLRVPTELAELSGLTKEVVLLGVRDHLELWDRAAWDEYLAGKQPQYDEIAESAFTPPRQQLPATPERSLDTQLDAPPRTRPR